MLIDPTLANPEIIHSGMCRFDEMSILRNVDPHRTASDVRPLDFNLELHLLDAPITEEPISASKPTLLGLDSYLHESDDEIYGMVKVQRRAKTECWTTCKKFVEEIVRRLEQLIKMIDSANLPGDVNQHWPIFLQDAVSVGPCKRT